MPAAISVTLAALIFWTHGSPCLGITRDSFESPRPTWRLAEQNGQATLLDQRRSFDRPHTGQTSEAIRIHCGRATKVYLTHDVTASRVISELAPEVWVRADRPGIQFLVRVVLPNSPSPNRDGPLTTVLHGNFYTQVGSWQKLFIRDTEQALVRQLPILRSSFGSNVSLKGAYVDLVILNAYTGPGTVNLAIDDLEVLGHVSANLAAADVVASTSNESSLTFRSPTAPDRDAESVRMKGSVLEVEQRPLFARGIEYNGEPLAWLKSVGFNVVELKAPPSAAQLQEAEKLGMWLIAPPPQVLGRSRIDAEFHRVLAWSLGNQLTHSELESSRKLAAEVRQADSRRSRPIVAAPAAHLWDYSRFAEIIRFDPLPIGSSFDSKNFTPWLRSRARLVRGRTCMWVGIQTEPHAKLVEQVLALSPVDAAHLAVDPEQIRQQVYQALSSGARGLIFRSRNRLDARGTAARLRAAILSMLNIELAAVEPWVAGGSYAGEIATGLEDVNVSVLETSGSRLLLVLRDQPQQQYVRRVAGRIDLTFLDAGATSSAVAYRVSPAAGLTTVTHWQKPGGVRIKLDQFRDTTAVVLTPDPLVRRFLANTSGQQAKAAADLQREIALRWFELFDTTMNRLVQLGVQAMDDPRLKRAVLVARQHLERSESLQKSGDFQSAIEFARNSQIELARARYVIWQQAASGFSAPGVSPFCSSFETLPVHWQVVQSIRAARWSPNRLPGGDCEDLDFMRRHGWRYHRYADSRLLSAVSVGPQAAFAGPKGLQLMVWAEKQDQSPAAIETPPAWITSAAVQVRQGQLARIHGRVKIQRAITGSLDGLMVFDSVGGLELGQRIQTAGPWSEFTLYRMMPRDGALTVTFALSGIGEVWLDDVTVQMIDSPVSLPATSPASTVPSTGQRRPDFPRLRRR